MRSEVIGILKAISCFIPGKSVFFFYFVGMENGEDDDDDGTICDLGLDGEGGETFLRLILWLT